ncbi:MAG TPA: pyridoxamine 5'-phosphate oxidase family protein [Syntrophobacteraceae bacterium]|nr:pyridoxamine 5'-phosphate oxidase family protein [Syntrophobacteraceae bacterium]
MAEEPLIERMKGLLRDNRLCVLATCHENRPHCSLMAYLCGEDARVIYLVTLANTRKFQNISLNPQVSLLVDSRTQTPGDPSRIQALTVTGTYSPLEDERLEAAILDNMLEVHPHIRGLIHHPAARVLPIRVRSFQLLDGALSSHFLSVE